MLEWTYDRCHAWGGRLSSVLTLLLSTGCEERLRRLGISLQPPVAAGEPQKAQIAQCAASSLGREAAAALCHLIRRQSNLGLAHVWAACGHGN